MRGADRSWVLVACALFLVACGGDDGAVVLVELQTDLVPGVEIDRVRTELLTDLPRVGSMAASRVAELSVAEGDDFSSAVRVAELDSIAVGSYFLRVQAILGAGIVAERILAVEIVGNAAFTVVMTRGCRGTRCPRAGDPASAVSCVGGLCVEAGCVTGREVECPPRECAGDSDCASTVACATGACVDGLCLLRADDAGCAEGERCHPELGCVDTSTCVPLTEICNGADDDCDGNSDEDFDLGSDLENCGVCGARCAGQNAAAECAGGTCTLTCSTGFGDCNASADDGCETDLTRPETCGACDAACNDMAPYCEEMRCTTGCTAPLELCGGACVSLSSDPAHCGGCGMVCPDPRNGTADCAAATCVTTCDPGFDDCNMLQADGCETPLDTLTSCGRCGAACTRQNATATCSGVASSGAEPTCRIQSCAAGFDNCDGNDANGCEASLTSLTSCGSCGTVCSRANATAICSAPGGIGMMPACRIQSCNLGFANCDANDSNGCETSTMTDPRHCGGCGIACGLDEVCEGGACVCGLSRGTVGGGAVCTAAQQCCPDDRCRANTGPCP